MSTRRICAIAYDYYPWEVLFFRTAQAAAGAGFESHVIALQDDGEVAEENYNGVHVHRLHMQRGYGQSLLVTLFMWTLFMFRSAVRVTRLHLQQRFDIIHVHNIPDFLVFAAIIPKLMGAKVILHVQDTSPELMAVKAEGSRKKLILWASALQEKTSMAFADHVITVGWPFEEKLVERGLSPSKLTNVLNSADPRIFPEERRTEALTGAATPERPLLLMYHGTAAERNGLETAVRAYAKARERAPHLRFQIKGQGETIPDMERLADELGVGDGVIFSAPCPPEQIVDFVLNGDVGVIPYRSDEFMDLVLPTKAYEFAWMRRAMIASDTPAIRSLFRPESVVLCEADNVDAFTEAIVYLYEHPEKRMQLIENSARDYAPYRWEEMATRFQNVLVAVAEGDQPPHVEASTAPSRRPGG